MWLLHRFGPGAARRKLSVGPVERRDVLRPQFLHQGDGLLDDGRAHFGGQSVRLEFLAVPAESDADVQPASGQDV